MSKFIYALTEDMKNKLTSEGCKLLHKTNINGSQAYVFVINDNKLNFDKINKENFILSDRLMF